MPRELIHWRVLEQTKRQLDSCSVFAQAMSLHPMAAKLGAVLHDAPYFLNFGGSEFEHVAELLHGTNGEDTFTQMRNLAAGIDAYSNAQRGVLLACLGGMLSHIASDVNFHPMVYYFSGNYYDSEPKRRHQARVKHRALEVWLDNVVRGSFTRSDTLLCDCLRSLSSQNKELIFEWLGSQISIDSHPSGAKNWRNAVSEMSRAQYLFVSNWSGALASLMRFGKFAEIEALFSWRRTGELPLFRKAISFSNPVSGEACSYEVRELLNSSAELSLGYLRDFELAIGQKDFSPGAIPVGKSLNFGLVAATPEQSRYYSDLVIP